MSALTQLVEASALADMLLDTTLASYTPTVHDARTTQDAKVTLTVAAFDDGEMLAGSGIHKVRVEVGINVNEKADGVTANTLDSLEEKVSDRLPVQVRTPDVQGTISGATLDPADQRLTTSSLKVFGILATAATPRDDAGLIRTRKVVRTLIAAQLA